MPYLIKKSKSKKDPRPYKIIKKDTGEVVGTSKTRKDAVGSVAHREDAMMKKEKMPMKKTMAKKAVKKVIKKKGKK